MPLSQRMGIKLASTTVTVISFGRSRCTAPSMTASSMSSCLKTFPLVSRREPEEKLLSVCVVLI
jgi:hypothetical protein